MNRMERIFIAVFFNVLLVMHIGLRVLVHDLPWVERLGKDIFPHIWIGDVMNAVPLVGAGRDHNNSAARFAESYIPTIRSWNESIFFNGLSLERSLEERRQIIEDYYGTYRNMVRDNPAGHGMDYVHAYTVISKIS